MSASRWHIHAGWVAVLALVVPLAAAGCGSDETGTPRLTWYVNPDNGGQKALAERCSRESGGRFTIATQGLPKEADAQREQLVRRLAAADPSIDLMSLDPVFVAEFANAGYLLPITDPADVETLTADVLDGPMRTVRWKGQLVAAPFWAATQLLWYRRSVAAAAGVDPASPEFTWDRMIAAAESQNKKVAVQASRYEGYMVLINALVSSAGGQVVLDPEAGARARPSLASPAGDAAAGVVGKLGRSSAAPADLSTSTEEEARAQFQSDTGGFMANWTYVYQAARSSIGKGLSQEAFDDIAWARYPRVDAGRPSTPPLGGIDLAIGRYSAHPAEALAAAKCITSKDSTVEYMLEEGNSAARAAAYDDPRIREQYPMADLIRESIDGAGPRPVTPYYGDVSTSVQRNWYPPAAVQVGRTPGETDAYLAEVLRGERLL